MNQSHTNIFVDNSITRVNLSKENNTPNPYKIERNKSNDLNKLLS